tara:strand:+ start:493 stop:1107 length:615 start_codon:yes stop_codon:yes gene_type:complete
MSIVTLNDRAVRSVSSFGSLNTGSMVFIKKLTASSSSDLTFINGSSDVVFDSTYKEYVFTFKDIHAPGGSEDFTFQVDTGTNTNFNQTITSSVFRAYHNEAGNDAALGYMAGIDQAQGTSFQTLVDDTGHDNDNCTVGYLRIFEPASTTFVKHFLATTNNVIDTYSQNFNVAGYFNTTTALTRVRFKMTSGNIDAGDICLYGIN